jgi:hypothetical protein
MEIESSIAMRYLRAGDVLILDNAANHTGKGTQCLRKDCGRNIWFLFFFSLLERWSGIRSN